MTSVAQTAGKLTVAGGTWSFSGANTFTGPVEITGGTMVLASSGALPASRPLLLNPAAGLFATLDIA
ncbi:autotransporter-associated beta strand repeat-containing protein, partial [Vibrio parahaemolyticus]|uniref:autotransporter-associated beta strand repeat-containing protein n=1 Tax=Vibrio parahaemolyticus TaxID=670 RepID=UPI002111BA97|nr:autotransporter-associated beta strand repeat-containing protein [Vibrio parahaemolyticus]